MSGGSAGLLGKELEGLHMIIKGAWRSYVEYGFVVEIKGVQTASLLVCVSTFAPYLSTHTGYGKWAAAVL